MALDGNVIKQVSERLGQYVYLLVDPRDSRPFYVGKGRGVRMLAHGHRLEAADDGELASATGRFGGDVSGTWCRCFVASLAARWSSSLAAGNNIQANRRDTASAVNLCARARSTTRWSGHLDTALPTSGAAARTR